jgi:hypothetical protein
VGIGVFIAVLLAWKAGVRVLPAILAGSGFSVFLFLIAQQLNLEYPSGLLNQLVPFWP